MTTTDLIPTGLPAVDALLGGGLPIGRLTLVSGRSQSGMTTMLDTIACQAIRQQTPTVLADLESPTRVRMTRLSAALSGVPFTDIRDDSLTAEQRAAIRTGDRPGAPFWFADDVRTIDDLSWQLGVDGIAARLALVDGTRLLLDGGMPRIMLGLDKLAASANVAVVATLPVHWLPDFPDGDLPVSAMWAAGAVLWLHRRHSDEATVTVTGTGPLASGSATIAADFTRARFLPLTTDPVTS
ncbi:DnaB-like helicase C-terminal domain-containing protein [Micromonospora sp. NPDC006766]|uniref:DnaB-like helicase C-terminal domain-containing protein n=1 Tax=Micromonospora sp. NPDC006766 TaxID=3154778 RepID=UPI0033C87562